MTSSSGRPSHPTSRVLFEIGGERGRQDGMWGEQNHPDGTGPHVNRGGARSYAYEAVSAREMCSHAADNGQLTWELILLEEVYEALAESDTAKLRDELIQVAAVAVAWVEAIDRRADN